MKKYNEYRVCEAMKLVVELAPVYLTEDDDEVLSDNVHFRRKVAVILKMQDEFIIRELGYE